MGRLQRGPGSSGASWAPCCCVSVAASDGAVSRQSKTGPLLSAPAQDRLVRRHTVTHLGWASTLPGCFCTPGSCQTQLLRLPPLLPRPTPEPHKFSGRVPVSQAPGETGSGTEPQLQKSQTTAPPCLLLLPSAALQFLAAFSLSLRLPWQGD